MPRLRTITFRECLLADLSKAFCRTMATQNAVPISAPPAAGQLVEQEGKIFDTVREGRAYILVPPNTRTSVDPQAKAKAGEHIHYSTQHCCAANSTWLTHLFTRRWQ